VGVQECRQACNSTQSDAMAWEEGWCTAITPAKARLNDECSPQQARNLCFAKPFKNKDNVTALHCCCLEGISQPSVLANSPLTVWPVA
jgi:hypothetical protein